MSHNGVDYNAIFETPSIIPEIRIHTHIDNTFYKENVIAFRENTPNNNTFNRFYDGANINELSADAYLLSNDKELVIKSIKYNDNTRLPLGLKASIDNTDFSIKIHQIKDVPEHVKIYIFDKENNTYTDIINNAFSITLDAGVYNNRFEITFKESSVLNASENAFTGFKVFQNNKISQLSLLNPNSLTIKSFSLFDVSGKQVMLEYIASESKNHSYSTKSLSDGVYIVKINLNDNQVFNKKIIIANRK